MKIKHIIVMAMIAMGGGALSTADVFAAPKASDPRADNLRSFFRAHHCPEPYHAEEYVRAADIYSVDYRLLPAVSVRESTCGLHQRLNNLWGWDSARTGFESVVRGIHYIMGQLAWGRYYRGKSVDQKLYVYNPNPLYVKEVRQLMREIDGD